MGKAGILTIDPKRFDVEVWQGETEFTERHYNTWLEGVSITLQYIHDVLDGSDDVSPEQLYALGGVINMLNAIEIKKQES